MAQSHTAVAHGNGNGGMVNFADPTQNHDGAEDITIDHWEQLNFPFW